MATREEMLKFINGGATSETNAKPSQSAKKSRKEMLDFINKGSKKREKIEYIEESHPDLGHFSGERFDLKNALSSTGDVTGYRSDDMENMRFEKSDDGRIWAYDKGDNKRYAIDPDNWRDLGEVTDWVGDVGKFGAGVLGGIAGAFTGGITGAKVAGPTGGATGTIAGGVLGNATGESLAEYARQKYGEYAGIPNNADEVGQDMVTDFAINASMPVAGKFIGKGARMAKPQAKAITDFATDLGMGIRKKVQPAIEHWGSGVKKKYLTLDDGYAQKLKDAFDRYEGMGNDRMDYFGDKLGQFKDSFNNLKSKTWEDGIDPYINKDAPIEMGNVKNVLSGKIDEANAKIMKVKGVKELMDEADKLEAYATSSTEHVTGLNKSEYIERAESLREQAMQLADKYGNHRQTRDAWQELSDTTVGGYGDQIDFKEAKDLYGRLGEASSGGRPTLLESGVVREPSPLDKEMALAMGDARRAFKGDLYAHSPSPSKLDEGMSRYSELKRYADDKVRDDGTDVLKDRNKLHDGLLEYVNSNNGSGKVASRKQALERGGKYLEEVGETFNPEELGEGLEAWMLRSEKSPIADAIRANGSSANTTRDALGAGGFAVFHGYQQAKGMSALGGALHNHLFDPKKSFQRMDDLRGAIKNVGKKKSARANKAFKYLDKVEDGTNWLTEGVKPNQLPEGLEFLSPYIRKDRMLYNATDIDEE